MHHLDFLTSDLSRLNSLTKYPSILTYHEIVDQRGNLGPATMPLSGELIETEKADGTNARVVLLPGGDWFLGLREEFLTARGDRVPNMTGHVVAALGALAPLLAARLAPAGLLVLFGEVYGKNVGGNARQYGVTDYGFRLFDAIELDLDAAGELLAMPRDKISLWRQNGHQPFVNEGRLHELAADAGVPLTPRVGVVQAADLPQDHQGMLDWLRAQIPATHLRIDEGGWGQAEGLVLRSADRSQICKLRFEDYERTLRSAQKGGGRAKVPEALKG